MAESSLLYIENIYRNSLSSGEVENCLDNQRVEGRMLNLTIFDFLKNAFVKKETPHGWREAAKSSNLAIKIPQPKFSGDIKLCVHLDTAEETRKKLENLLINNWSARADNLLEEFFQICASDDVIPNFPKEIETIVLDGYKGKPNQEALRKKVATVYIRHELNVLKNSLELDQGKGVGVKKVKIRTCEDGRVCSACRKHSKKTYSLEKAPQLPLCWECRCYYELVIK